MLLITFDVLVVRARYDQPVLSPSERARNIFPSPKSLSDNGFSDRA